MTKSSISSPAAVVSEMCPSFDAVIECLNRINDQNKKLLDFVGVLAEKVKDKDNAGDDQVIVKNSTDKKSVLDDVNTRLEKIEQNLNVNTLVCRGPAVEQLIGQSGESPNLERLKGEVCKGICGDEVTGLDIDNLQLSIFGGRKCLKLNCAKSTSKLHLLRKAREKRLQGMFLPEFLTETKLKVFYNL